MKAILKWKPHGKRPLGRPKQRWIDKVTKNLTEIGIRDGKTVAQDRDRWKQVCVTVMDLMTFKTRRKRRYYIRVLINWKVDLNSGFIKHLLYTRPVSFASKIEKFKKHK